MGARAPLRSKAWARWALLGPLSALGMAALAYSGSALGVALCSGIEGASDSAWRLAPGWIALAWVSKRAAAARWWNKEGSAFFAVGMGMVCVFLAWGGRAGAAWGWAASTAICCMWPLARERLAGVKGDSNAH